MLKPKGYHRLVRISGNLLDFFVYKHRSVQTNSRVA